MEANERAMVVYKRICDWMDEKGLHYKKIEEDFAIRYIMSGDDIPMDFVIRVKPKTEVVFMISPLPLSVPDDKKVEIALAVALANENRILGSFDYDLTEGRIAFKLVDCYKGSDFSTEMLEIMISLGASMVDDFNDKFLMVAKGVMSLDQFADFAQNN